MPVQVDEPGHDILAGQVDRLSPSRSLELRHRAHPDDTAGVENHGGASEGLAAPEPSIRVKFFRTLTAARRREAPSSSATRQASLLRFCMSIFENPLGATG